MKLKTALVWPILFVTHFERCLAPMNNRVFEAVVPKFIFCFDYVNIRSKEDLITIMTDFPSNIDSRQDRCFLRCLLRMFKVFTDERGSKWHWKNALNFYKSYGFSLELEPFFKSALFTCVKKKKVLVTKYGCKNAYNLVRCLMNHGVSFRDRRPIRKYNRTQDDEKIGNIRITGIRRSKSTLPVIVTDDVEPVAIFEGNGSSTFSDVGEGDMGGEEKEGQATFPSHLDGPNHNTSKEPMVKFKLYKRNRRGLYHIGNHYTSRRDETGESITPAIPSNVVSRTNKLQRKWVELRLETVPPT